MGIGKNTFWPLSVSVPQKSKNDVVGYKISLAGTTNLAVVGAEIFGVVSFFLWIYG